MATAIFTVIALVCALLSLTFCTVECREFGDDKPPKYGLGLAFAAVVAAFLAGRWSL